MKNNHRPSLALWLSCLVCLLFAHGARAQVSPTTPSSQAAPSAATPAPDATLPAPEAAPAAVSDASITAQLQAMQARLDAQQAELTAMRAQLSASEQERALEAQVDSINAQDTDLSEYAKPETVSIYGYLDVGFQRLFAPKSNPVADLLLSDAGSFLVGNLNFYFDVSPATDWRGLTEIRFTNLPHGQESLGVSGIAPYSRANNVALNQTSPDGRDQVLVGGVIIERAWIQWQRYSLFNVRVGQWFTPFGIWNVDHGSPVLITVLQPDFQIAEAFPSRQTGVLFTGDVPVGGLTLGYSAYVSNGRTVTLFDFSDDKAVGGRMTLTRPGGDVITAGLSGYYGTSQDQTKTLVSVSPLNVVRETVVDYTEYTLGVDFAFDLGPLRVRTEGVMRHIEYEPGKHAPAPRAPPGSIAPNSYYWSGYALAAYRLPVWGLEPTFAIEGIHRPAAFGNTLLNFAPGFNIHFEPTVQLKNVIGYVLFIDAPGVNGTRVDTYMWIVQTRLVVAF